MRTAPTRAAPDTDRHVLAFAAMRVPRAHESGAMVANRIEALDVLKAEPVHEADFAAVVDRQSASNQRGLHEV